MRLPATLNEQRLLRALRRLVVHDMISDKREGLENCTELQAAQDLIEELYPGIDQITDVIYLE